MQPRALIDLNEVEELRGLARGPRGVTLRPLTRYRELAATSALRGALQAIGDAASTVGDRQVRNAGTIGGSLCWNYVASCLPNVCLCLDATLVLTSLADGERTLPVDKFLIGPLETARRDDELLIEIRFPPFKQPGVGSAHRKHGATVDGLPIVGIAALIEVDASGVCTDARFSTSAVFCRPLSDSTAFARFFAVGRARPRPSPRLHARRRRRSRRNRIPSPARTTATC